MTTRAELKQERNALVDLMCGLDDGCVTHEEALNASIARLDVLLRLSDEQISSLVEVLLEGVGSPPHTEWEHSRMLVADLIRRTS